MVVIDEHHVGWYSEWEDRCAVDGLARRRSRIRSVDGPDVSMFGPAIVHYEFEGMMSLSGEVGYKEIELLGPYPFRVPEAQERWAAPTHAPGVSRSDYFGRSPIELRQLLERNGLWTLSKLRTSDAYLSSLEDVPVFSAEGFARRERCASHHSS